MQVTRRQFVLSGSSLFAALSALETTRGQVAVEKPLAPRQPAERLDGPPIVSARAWAIADGRTGEPLWGANQANALAMASTTKIMTAWVVLRLASDEPQVLDEMVTISTDSDNTGGSTAAIRAGDRYPTRDLLYGLLLPSGNDAAFALAEHFGPRFRAADENGTPVGAFVRQMNRQAEALRMRETSYLDPHGLGRNQTSARNLATLAFTAMQNPVFRQYVQTRRHSCEATAANGERRQVVWNNTNRLLEMEGYDGIKTGTTSAAGFCLAASGRHDGDHLLVVVLGSTSNDSRYVDARNLFRWAWRERARRTNG